MYLVIELQKTGDQVVNIVTTHETNYDAESKFHTVLAYAAVSPVDIHSAVLMDDKGFVYRTESYDHTTAVEEVTEEPEPVEE